MAAKVHLFTLSNLNRRGSVEKGTGMANEAPQPDQSPLAGVVHRNIETLLNVREQLKDRTKFSDRIADSVGSFAGSMWFVYVHAILFLGWFVINLGWIGFIPPFERFPFVTLTMIASLEAIFLSTFVLITQNRMAAIDDKRSELDLQINLLAEHEVTRLISMVEDIRHHLGIATVSTQEIEELKVDVNPEEVWQQIVKAEEERGSGPTVE